MKNVRYEYDVIVGDKGQCSYKHTNRDDARKELRDAKADGFDAKIIQHTYVLQESKQVR